MTTCEPCEGVQIETRLSVFGIRDSSTDDSSTDDDEDDDCANCHACILHRMLDAVPNAIKGTCCAIHLTTPMEEQIEMVKMMPNANAHKVVILRARAQLKLIPRHFAKLKQMYVAIDTVVARTARSAIEGVLAAARERDAAAKRAANGKKKREKKRAAVKRAAAAVPHALASAATAVEPMESMKLDDYGPDAMYCVICLDNVKNVLHTGCGHVATCSTCSEHLDACPLCRAPVTANFKLVKVHVF